MKERRKKTILLNNFNFSLAFTFFVRLWNKTFIIEPLNFEFDSHIKFVRFFQVYFEACEKHRRHNICDNGKQLRSGMGYRYACLSVIMRSLNES